jgi:uncharacterized protein YbjT (DUF2867 family)
MILITGATGNVGSEVVKILSRQKHRARAFVRRTSKARPIALPGIELVEGDFAQPDTIARSLEGVDRLFLLIPSSSQVEPQQRHFVDAAKRSGVKHIIKLSQLGADTRSTGRFQRYHGAVEDYIRESGLNYTFLRPNLFMQGLLNFRAVIAAQGAFYVAAGDARVSIVDVRDIAAIVALALTEPGHEGKVYEITGPESLTHAEMADRLSTAIGKTVKYVNISPNAMREALVGFGMPEWQASGLVEDYDLYRRGEAAKVTTTVREVAGTAPIAFSQFARDYADAFRSKAVGAS